MTMNYIPQSWIDGASGGTPVAAARLMHMEDGILDASTRLGVVEASNAVKDIALVATGTKTATYNAAIGDLVLADASSGTLPIVLPAALPGMKIAIKKMDSSVNVVAITAHGSDTIEGSSVLNLRLQYESRTLISGNGIWYVAGGVTTLPSLDSRYALKLTPTASLTANYTAAAGDLVRMDVTSAARTVTLPAAVAGAMLAVRKLDSSANTVTLTPNGSDTIDGSATSVLRMPGEARVMIGIAGGWVTQSHSKSSQLQRLWNSGTLAPSATANTNGTAANMTPTTNLMGFTGVLMARFNGTGTYGSETVTCTFTATFNDGTTTTTALTATNTTPVLFAAANQIALAKDACFITQISVVIKSTIGSSAARGNVDILALQV
jgi:hypothetical protein